MSATQIEINLTAAIVAVEHETPLILVAGRRGGGPLGEPGLPSGPFDPLSHRTFEIGLRAWVVEQTALAQAWPVVTDAVLLAPETLPAASRATTK